ncbi:cortexin-1 isoform X1 [Larus michahellis]|uniref:cortexin-1 isoform X1 n=1 Tax=Larus michahellis TaxID=119627 RepID=UPI003D9BCA5E
MAEGIRLSRALGRLGLPETVFGAEPHVKDGDESCQRRQKVPWTPAPAASELASSRAARGRGWCVKVLEREQSPASKKLSSRWERQPKRAGPWRPFRSDVAVWTQPSPPPAAVAMLVSPRSCSEELSARAGVNPELGVAALVAME